MDPFSQTYQLRVTKSADELLKVNNKIYLYEVFCLKMFRCDRDVLNIGTIGSLKLL